MLPLTQRTADFLLATRKRACSGVRSIVSRAGAAAFIAAVIQLGGCKQALQTPPPSVPDVRVVTVETTSLPLEFNYSGHTAGSREVEVRARVSGILLARKFQEGRPVKQGQVLFEIDPEPLRAALAQAQAELAMSRAQAAQAKREAKRILTMAAQGLVSQLQRDQAQSASEIADANRQAAEARVRKAQLDLSYTEVRAPISGLASNEAHSEGSLVTAGSESSLLTRIVQADPLYVEFNVPDIEATTLRTALAKAQAQSDAHAVTARIELADGSLYPDVAQLTFLDNAVATDSGSVAARAIVRNPTHALLPGQFVRVHVQGLQLHDVISLPRKAVLNGADGQFVWLVDKQNAAVRQPVTLGMAVGDQVVVKSGLQPGDRVVVEGVMQVAVGDHVAVVMPALAGGAESGASSAGAGMQTIAADKAGTSLVKSIE